MWKFILANFPFPIWFDDNPYLLARFFSEQLNGATVPVLQADNSGAYGHGTNQETAGSCEFGNRVPAGGYKESPTM